MELLRSGSFVAALEHALDLDEAHAATWVLRARAHFAMGSLGAAHYAYARAHSNEARDEAQQLQRLISGWFDHPARLAILFPLPRRHNRCAPAAVRRCDGIYAAAPAVEVAYSVFEPSTDSEALRGVVVYFHGNGEDADDCLALAAPFHSLRLALVVVEYRGYGRSPPATPLLSTLLTDAEPFVLGTVLGDALRLASLPPDLPPLLFGRSIGGHVAVHLATLGASRAAPPHARGAFRALILDSAVASVRHWTAMVPEDAPTEGRPPMPAGLHTAGLLENREKLRATATPLLVLHGDEDAIVPPFQAELLHRASAAPAERKRCVRFPRRGHNDLVHDPSYWPSVASFVESVFDGG